MIIVREEIEEYARAQTERPAPLLEELTRETYASMADPQMQVGPLEGAFLRLLVRLVNARRVLELGTFTGYSALMMAEALPPDGELITCDIDPQAAEMAKRYFAQSPHGKKIDLRLGRASDTVATLKAPFDLVFVDADKESYPLYYQTTLPLLRTGGLFVADNALWDGRVLDPESADDRAIVQMNATVAADPRVEKVLLTVRDGMMLAQKR